MSIDQNDSTVLTSNRALNGGEAAKHLAEEARRRHLVAKKLHNHELLRSRLLTVAIAVAVVLEAAIGSAMVKVLWGVAW